MQPTTTPTHGAYHKVNVETASQGKLIVMLFNGAIQRSEEAKRNIERGNPQAAHQNLIRAQDIIGELRGALNMKAGDVARNLDRIYEYYQHLLIKANVRKETEPIALCVELMAQIRDTWQQLFEELGDSASAPAAPRPNPHGASLLNLEG